MSLRTGQIVSKVSLIVTIFDITDLFVSFINSINNGVLIRPLRGKRLYTVQNPSEPRRPFISGIRINTFKRVPRESLSNTLGHTVWVRGTFTYWFAVQTVLVVFYRNSMLMHIFVPTSTSFQNPGPSHRARILGS